MNTDISSEHNKQIICDVGNLSNHTSESVDSNNENCSGKKVRRSFSITRMPFRWSHKFKLNNNNVKCEKSKKKDNETIRLLKEGQHGTELHQNHKSSTTANKVLRNSSFRKFLSRIAQHVTSMSSSVKKNLSSTTQSINVSDRVPPIGGYQWSSDQTPGTTGLKNHGNTCFMNAVLQCLSHTDILAEYFVLDQYKADLKRRNKLNSKKFGTKGELTEQLANVLKALWTCKNENDHSTSFKAVVDRYGSQFQSTTQHDAQEFLFWLLDKVHEDLNTATKKRYKTIKNNYGRPDEVIAAETLANHIRCNNSFVQAVFQAQFRSSLTCPRCHKQSNTFDPFHCISVQLPQLSQQIIFVTVLYVKQHPRQVKLGLTVPSGSPIIALREQLNADTGIPSNRMVLADIDDNGFSRVFYNSQPISTLNNVNSIYCIEIPEMKDESSSELMLLIANVKKLQNGSVCRFGTPFCLSVNRDCSYMELQKKLLKEMCMILKPEVFTYSTPLTEMFEIQLQDPSADPDTYLEQVEHPLFTEMIDMALSIQSSDAGPSHVKLLLEWEYPEKFFLDMNDSIVEHESVSILKDSASKHVPLTLEQCLEHYTKAETLSAEDAWRCPNCQQYLPVVKTLGLWSLPDILVIHFKRFRQQNDKGPDAAKLTTMVKFPLNAFDMSPHLVRGSTSNDSLNNVGSNRHLSSPWRKTRDLYKCKDRENELKDNHYDLYAVCYHQGETLETGHYTAACKNPYNRQWYKFDDQKVTQVPSDKVQEEIVNNEAYILFYQRRKIDSIECSGTSSTSGDHWISKIAVPATPSKNLGDKMKTNCNVPVLLNSSNPNDNHPEDIDTKTNESKNIDKKTDNFILKMNDKQPTEATFTKETNENEIVDEETLKNDLTSSFISSVDNELNNTKCPANVIKENLLHSPKGEDKLEDEKHSKEIWPKDIMNNDINDINNSFITSVEQNENINNSTESSINKRYGNQEASGNHYNKLRYSFSTNSSYKLKDCDTLSMIRNSSSSCKDTLLYIDQQNHSLMEEDESFLGSQSIWGISPVTPHKLITVSPKN